MQYFIPKMKWMHACLCVCGVVCVLVCVCEVCVLLCVVCVLMNEYCVVCVCVYDEICQMPPGVPRSCLGCIIPSDVPSPPAHGAPKLSPVLQTLPPG